MEDHSNLKKICLSALREAKKTVESLGEEGRKELPKQGEPLTKSDMAVSKTLKKHFLNSSLDAIFHSEEAGIINSPSDPRYIIYFDEIDGTFNYQRGGLLPSTTVISAFNHSETPKFKEAVFAAVMDVKNNNLWYAEKDKGCYFNGEKVKPSKIKDLGRDVFAYIDHGPCPSREEMEKFANVYGSCWSHNVSSAGFGLACVASGHADIYILNKQKAHELGAGYLLVKEAGGYLVDFKGNSLDNQEFKFDKTYPIISAGNKELGEKLREKI